MKVLLFVLVACMLSPCVFSGTVTLAVNEIPNWDLCANGGDIYSCSGHGMCSGVSGRCVCTDGYTGRDCSVPPGGFKYAIPKASVTQFCQLETGGCAPGMCVGGGSFDHTNLPKGIDGVAAVNPTLFGGRYAYAKTAGAGIPYTVNGMYSFVGQSCGTCWKLTRKAITIVVTVVDRCAGYCRATVGENQRCSADSPQGGKECGECIQIGQASAPQCSCLSRESINHNGWCNGYPTAHCDWCAANDHPHFDLDITAQLKICDEAAVDGFCHLDSFQMVACPDFLGPWPNGYPNGTGAPKAGTPNTAQKTSSSSDSKCSFDNGNGVCSSIDEGEFVCNGCNLTMCNHGILRNLGCAAGTSCKNGKCEQNVPCDPKLTLCTPSTNKPTVRPPPPAEGTTKPISATTAPAAATTSPTAAPKAATAQPATQAPAPKAATTAPTAVPKAATTAPTAVPKAATTAPTPATPAPTANQAPAKCARSELTPEEQEMQHILAEARAVEKYRSERAAAMAQALEQQKREL